MFTTAKILVRVMFLLWTLVATWYAFTFVDVLGQSEGWWP